MPLDARSMGTKRLGRPRQRRPSARCAVGSWGDRRPSLGGQQGGHDEHGRPALGTTLQGARTTTTPVETIAGALPLGDT